MRAWVRGVGIWGPGLTGWEASRPVLAGTLDPSCDAVPPPAPSILSATERRRASLVVRLALTVAEEATAMAGCAAGSLRAVFGSANGEGAVVHAILDALSSPGGAVSPTQFHNSVHNAAAGYWSIGTGSRRPVTCLGCHDGTAGAALTKALAEVEAEREPVLLCLYDAPLPPPLFAKRPNRDLFAMGLVLGPEPCPSALARLEASYHPSAAPPGAGEPDRPALRALARANPAARSLGLLQALARGRAERAVVPMPDGHLRIEVEPWSGASGSPR